MSADIDFSQFIRKSNPDDIDFSSFKREKERGVGKKAARVGMQAGIGVAENALLPYELGVAPLASKEAQHAEYRKELFADIERLQEQKASGQWDQKDEELLSHLTEQVKSPEKAEKFVKTADIGVGGLIKKSTGIDTHPEGTLEKAARWTGFLSKPSSIKELAKMGTSPKQVIKSIIPGGKELARGLGAGSALQLAEEGNFGPIGTLAAAVAGDFIGGGGAGAIKGGLKAISQPKQTLAKLASLTANNKSAIVKDLSEASKGKPFTKDIGTLTDNNIVQMIQARLAASGFTGKPLEELRKKMTKEIVEEYENVVKELGESKFETLHEAGEAGKEALTTIRDAEKARISELYTKARERLTVSSVVNPTKLANTIHRLEESLKPGAVKSTEQKAVLDVLERLKSDVYDTEGQIKGAKVQDLINNKTALNDIINYEVQGGQKQLLKALVHDLDKLIMEYGQYDRQFLKYYAQANKDFGNHAKTFRNQNINNILKSENPITLMNKMNSAQGLKDIRNALSHSEEGKEMFNSLARKKMNIIFNDTGMEGIKEQLKFGKFSNVLEKGKNREIVKELLSPEAYKKLVVLQKHSGQLAETAQKFLNTSQTATSSADLKSGGTILMGVYGLITGNPFALTGAGIIGGARMLSGLISDPKFLSLVEEAIVAGKKTKVPKMEMISKEMVEMAKQSVPAAQLAQNP